MIISADHRRRVGSPDLHGHTIRVGVTDQQYRRLLRCAARNGTSAAEPPAVEGVLIAALMDYLSHARRLDS